MEAASLAQGIEQAGAVEALLAAASAHPQLAESDLVALAVRAREQRDRIEAVHLAAARRAFASPG